MSELEVSGEREIRGEGMRERERDQFTYEEDEGGPLSGVMRTVGTKRRIEQR